MSLLRLLNLQFTIPGNDEFLGIVFCEWDNKL